MNGNRVDQVMLGDDDAADRRLGSAGWGAARVLARARRGPAGRTKARVLAGLIATVGCVAIACGMLPTAGLAQEEPGQNEPVEAGLHTSFTPNRLGASTTIGFDFSLKTAGGFAPSPLTGMDLHMPAGMNYTETTLGLATCTTHTLETSGAEACPVNSRLGSGSAFVEVPFGKGAGHELPKITAFMGNSTTGNMVVLFYVDGKTPVYGQYIFTGEVLPQNGVFGSQLNTVVPLVKSVPDGPDVSIVRGETSIGPRHLTYYHRVHGRLRSFHPRGIAVPERCPKGGFPFYAQFSFLNGTHAEARYVAPCPKAAKRRRRH